MDRVFLEKFIPYGEMAVIRDNPEAFRDELERVECQLRSLPTPEAIYDKDLDEIRIFAHYFGGASDWWVYALEKDCEYAEAFVCLNRDGWNAEVGPIYIPELLPVNLINLDLHWNDETTLKQVMDRVKRQAE